MTLVMPMVKIRLKCPDVDSFVDKYVGDVNSAGMFVRTRSPLAAGTPVSFDVRLADDSCLFRGSGTVAWARPNDTLAPLLDAGMMLSFDELREGTREHFELVLARKRVMDEAADTVPTLVRVFSGEPRETPPTTKLAAAELEELRSRMRAQMAAEGKAPPPPPVELVAEPLLPMLVPAEPREHIEARPLPPPPPTEVPLAKIVVLRPQPAVEAAPTVDDDDLTPLPPALPGDILEMVAPLPPAGEVTELVERPPARGPSGTLIGIGIASGTLALGVFALVRLNLAQRLLEWIAGA